MISSKSSLQIGDRVQCAGYPAGGRGVIVEQLRANCVRVLWDDQPTPTTHRSESLRRCRLQWPWRIGVRFDLTTLGSPYAR